VRPLVAILLSCAACGGHRYDAPDTVLRATPATPARARQPAPADPCTGDDLDLAALGECRVTEEGPPPPPEHLGIAVGPLAPVASAGELDVPIVLTNEHHEPIRVYIDLSCSGFETSVWNEAGERVDLDDSALLGALCGRDPPIRATILPGGRLRASVPFRAVRMAYRCGDDDVCERVEAGPIRPGAYTLRLRTPISDCRDEAGTTVCDGRTADTPLTIVAAGR
jgi:hypothetical protein